MRFVRQHWVFLIAVAVMPRFSAQAAIVVDQSQLLGLDYMAQFSQTDLAQSFQQSFNNITGARVQTQPGIGGAGDVSISLWNDLPNVFGAVQLASGTAFGVTPGAFANVSFGSTVPVIPNTTLYLVFTSTNPSQGLAGSVSNPYPLGMTFANPGYGPFPGFDYTFETFADNTFGGVVPEATSIVIWSCVTGCAMFIRRRARG